MSDKTRVVFTIKESAEGHPYLTMEFHDPIPGLPDDPPVFDLKPGATLEEAKVVAAFLNENITGYRPFPHRPRSVFQTHVK